MILWMCWIGIKTRDQVKQEEDEKDEGVCTSVC